MAIPRAKKKKKVNVPSKPEQDRIMEANWLCISVAAEQLYTDNGWRVKRINNLIEGFWYELGEVKAMQNRLRIRNIHERIAYNAGQNIGVDIISMCKKLDPYRCDCYMLCVGCLVKALRKLKVSKLRCKLIVGAIFVERKIYEPWSVYQACKEVTGLDVRMKLQWE